VIRASELAMVRIKGWYAYVHQPWGSNSFGLLIPAITIIVKFIEEPFPIKRAVKVSNIKIAWSSLLYFPKMVLQICIKRRVAPLRKFVVRARKTTLSRKIEVSSLMFLEYYIGKFYDWAPLICQHRMLSSLLMSPVNLDYLDYTEKAR